MFEAKLEQAAILKKLLDAIKELVTDANFDCNEEGLNLQAMDNSHVALVAVQIKKDGFRTYRCDHAMPLGVNLVSLTKVLKCAKDDDQVTLGADNNGDILRLKYDAKNTDRVAEYEMKLMDIDTETLGIPPTDYDARVVLPSAEFARIVRDLAQLGESVRIEVNKDGISFTSEGDTANGTVTLKPTSDGSRQTNGSSSKKAVKVKKEAEDNEDVEMVEEDDAGSGDEEASKAKVDEDEDEVVAEDSGSEESESESKKRKRKSQGKQPAAKKAKKSSSKKREDDDDGDDDDKGVLISLTQSVTLSFSLKYLVNFSKSTGLTSKVELKMSSEVPLLVSYEFEQGHIQYYLAPKIGDE